MTISEKEKMLAGKPYFSNDKELVTERAAVRDQLLRFNNMQSDAQEEQNSIIRKLLCKTGNQFCFEPPFRCDYGYNISIGENFYANFNLLILDGAPVSIGDNAFIAPNVSIFTAGHPVHHEPRNQQFEYVSPVQIGNNVWVGGGTIINPGVTIGDNTVIGSGSVVTKDIPSNVIAVGNPCRVLREITDEDKQYCFKKKKF